jgi:hypothetical protein
MMNTRFSITALFLFLSLPAFASAQALPTGLLDSGSVECLGCHQDSITVNEPLQVCHQGDCDHLLGVSYASFSSKNRGLVPPERLDQAIKLIDGKVGCLSCHTRYIAADHENVAAADDTMLSVDNTGSGLCAACHRK